MYQEKLDQLKSELGQVNDKLTDPSIYSSQKSSQIINQQRKLQKNIELIESAIETKKEIQRTKKLLSDPIVGEEAKQEITHLSEKMRDIDGQIKLALLPKDPDDDRNAILEIRAGAGGDESSLFAQELSRMYIKFLEKNGYKVSLLSASYSEIGGYKEAIFEVSGEEAYGLLKYESGVHRVQRVPQTESSGRIHTSAVSVVVLPEAEEEDLEINQNDLRIDVFRSSGHGGQSVNTTDSAVRITHLPTNIVVTCQDEKSQLKNKQKALSILRSRLLDKKREQEQAQLKDKRLDQIGSGDRSEKIRTYNFPQDRVTDHRIHYTQHGLVSFLDGEMDNLINALKEAQINLILS
jgi:peptide chain release factor 1